MKKKQFLFLLKLFILLSPIPFGCVGRLFSPLFYLFLLILSFIGINLISKKQGLNSTSIIYEKWIKRLLYAFLIFIAFQIIPLPFFLLKILSPETANTLNMLNDKSPAFHSISLVPFDTLIDGLKFISFVFFFWVVFKIRLNKVEIVSILNTIILSAALQTIFGLIKYLMGNKYFFLFFYPDKSKELKDYLTGTLGNTNHFAFYLEMIIPLALALFFLKLNIYTRKLSLRERFVSAMNADKRTMAYLMVCLLLGIGIILTGSRSGIVTFFLSFLIFGLLAFYIMYSVSVRKKLRTIFIFIIIIAIFIGAQNTFKKFMSTTLESSGRFLRWPNTIAMFSDFPLFGTGFGTYRYSYFLYDTDYSGKWSTHAHNDYFEILSELGLLGGILFILLIGVLLFSIIQMWGVRRHPEVKMIGIGILSGIFAAVFHSFFDFSLHIPSNVLIFVLIMVLGVKIVTYKRVFKVEN